MCCGGLITESAGGQPRRHGASSLRLVDTHWKTRATLATWPDGSPFLQLTDRDGKDRALLRYAEMTAGGAGALIKRPGPSLLFFNQEETVIWQAP